MINETSPINIFETKKKHIAFPINKENVTLSGLVGKISHEVWPDLSTLGPHNIGDVLTQVASDGRMYHALVCYSLEKGWLNQQDIVKHCFDKIPAGKEEISSLPFGKDFAGRAFGVNPIETLKGMEASKKKICLHTGSTLPEVQDIIKNGFKDTVKLEF